MAKLRKLVALALLIASSPAFAATALAPPEAAGKRLYQRCVSLNVSGGSESLLAAVAADASAATRTVNITNNLLFSEIGFQLDAVEAGAITAATVTMTCSRNGTTYGTVDTIEPAGSGAVTQFGATWTKAITASGVVLFDFDISKCKKAEFVFGLTGGGATDTLTVVGNVCAP